MPNTLGLYNPTFYAQEALIQLEKALGLAGRIHRGYDAERRAFNKGDTISINRPGTFTAQNAPSSAQDLLPQSVNIVLSRWKEVKFTLTDKELAYTTEKIIDDHIRPAAVAIADEIDQFLAAFYKSMPWFYDLNATPGSVVTDVTGPHRILFDNKVPMDETMLHMMVNGAFQAGLIGNSAFGQWQGAGPEGVATQMRGAMGRRFGINFFANQNVQAHVKGTCDDTALKVGAAGGLLGAVTLDLLAVDGTVTGTLVAGDTFVIAGNTQRYAVTALATAAANAFTAVAITPPLVQAHAANDAVTVRLDNHNANMLFHRNFAAIAMAPLSDMANALGAKVTTITDPITGLSIRSRVFYDGNNSKVYVALDVLYGGSVLDPNLGVRVCD